MLCRFAKFLPKGKTWGRTRQRSAMTDFHLTNSGKDLAIATMPKMLLSIKLRRKPSRTRGQKCLPRSKNRHHNEKPSATGLFTKGQNLVADGQTSMMPSTTSGAGQTETNLGKQKRGCFASIRKWFNSLYAIDFAVKLITFSFPNNRNPARATNTLRAKCNNFHNIHHGSLPFGRGSRVTSRGSQNSSQLFLNEFAFWLRVEGRE